ncbi:MAG TPA: hypothetical protein PLY93_13190 [Turneriella sp.]|nr:hypothetical protein [Turneriella sp.]
MKKIYSTLLIIMSLVIFTHCEKHRHGDDHEHGHENSSGALRLDNGKKWMADDITRQTYKGLNKDIRSAQLNDAKAIANFVAAQVKRVNALIQGCTMKGEAHNQLHLLIEKTQKDLAAVKKTSPKNIEVVLHDLAKSTALFEKYFE